MNECIEKLNKYNYDQLHKQILCINDIPGSGKSYSALSIIQNTERSIYKIFNLYESKNIIIVSHRLIDQWDEYLKKFKLNYICIKSIKKINILEKKLNKYNTILLSAMFIKKYFSKFNNITYLRCFVDDHFEIFHSENNLQLINEILIKKSLFKYTIDSKSYNKSYFDMLEIDYFVKLNYFKVQDYLIRQYLNIPIPNFNSINLTELLKDVIKNSIKLSKNDENIIKELNINNYNDNNIISKIFKNNDINNVKIRILINKCPICYENILEKIVLLCCKNVCCNICFAKIKKCMFCRHEIKQLKSISQDEIFEYQIQHLKTLFFNTNFKMLIIGNLSDVSTNLKKLSLILLNKIAYAELTYFNIFKNIKNNNIKVLYTDIFSYHLINGLNTQSITHLIILNDLIEDTSIYNIVNTMQRAGRFTQLNVYKYFMKNVS